MSLGRLRGRGRLRRMTDNDRTTTAEQDRVKRDTFGHDEKVFKSGTCCEDSEKTGTV